MKIRKTHNIGEPLAFYTQKELYDAYISEGRSHHEALALSQKLSPHLQNLNKQTQRMWQRSLRDKELLIDLYKEVS